MPIRQSFAFLAIAAAASAVGHAHAVVVLTNGQSINLATLLASGSDRYFVVFLQSWCSS